MGTPFNVGVKGLDPSLSRVIQALQNALNSDIFLERSHSVLLSGQRADGWSLDNYYKANQLGFESWRVAGETNGTALTTLNPAVDTLIAVPFVAGPFVIEGIGFEVTTGSGANGKARVGIYSATKTSDGAFYPGAIVLDSGQFDVTGTGVKSTTALAVRLNEGSLYFAAYLCGTANPTIRGVAVGGTSAAMGLPSTFGAAPSLGFTVASTYNASLGLPGSYPTGATAHSTAIPAVAFRHQGGAVHTMVIPVWSPASAGHILKRVRMISALDVSQQTTGPFFTVDAAIRRGEKTTVLGSYDGRSNKLDAGAPFNLTGKNDLDRQLLPNDLLEIKVSQNGRPLQDLSQIMVQFDTAYAGG